MSTAKPSGGPAAASTSDVPNVKDPVIDVTTGQPVGIVEAISGAVAWVQDPTTANFATIPLANLRTAFTPGWYRHPDNPWTEGAVILVRRNFVSAWPSYTILVPAADA